MQREGSGSTQVSTEEALKKATLFIAYPIIALMMLGLFGAMTLGILELIHPALSIVGGIFTGTILAFLYWMVAIVHWRLWAFSSVQNVHRLKRHAIKQGLLWPDGSWWEMLEIRTASQQQAWDGLQRRFLESDAMVDDVRVPDTYPVYYSISSRITLIFVGLSASAGLGYAAIKANGHYTAGFILGSAAAFCFAIYQLVKSLKRTPVFVLSNEGICDGKGTMHLWESIRAADVVYSSPNYLVLEMSNPVEGIETKSIEINDLTISREKLGILLELYRSRHGSRR